MRLVMNAKLDTMGATHTVVLIVDGRDKGKNLEN